MRTITNFRRLAVLAAVAVLPMAVRAQYRELPRLEPIAPLRPLTVPAPLVLAPPPPPPPQFRLPDFPIRVPVCHEHTLTWTDANGIHHEQTIRHCD